MSKRTNATVERTVGTREFVQSECPVERVNGCYPNRCFMRDSVGCTATEEEANAKRDKAFHAIVDALNHVREAVE